MSPDHRVYRDIGIMAGGRRTKENKRHPSQNEKFLWVNLGSAAIFYCNLSPMNSMMYIGKLAIKAKTAHKIKMMQNKARMNCSQEPAKN